MRRLFIFAVFIFSFLSLFSSGTLDSEDGWLYLSVAKNFYYTGKLTAAPNEYAQQKNVNMNSTQDKNGEWHARYAVGYSLAMVPAVALSDVIHHIYQIPPVTHFPLEHDWSLHFFASFTNMFFAALLAIIFVLYARSLGMSEKSAYMSSMIMLFATNLFPLSKFSFPHMMFTSFIMVTFYSIKRFSMTNRYRYIFYGIISFCIAAIGYNLSYLIVFPSLLMYFILLTPKNRRLWKLMGVVCFVLLYFFGKDLVAKLQTFNLKTIIEGLWGFLFSAGKSIFLYSPPLLILPLFWHKLHKKYKPEILSFTVLSLCYLIFFSSPRLREDVYIWHGGMVWGPRYVSTLIPFGILLAALIVHKLSPMIRRIIWYPLIALGIFIQILGTTNTYLIQYRNLPYHIFVGSTELNWYDYPSFIPRFSPLFIMSRNFFESIREFPKTLSHGTYNTRLFDGFLLPLKMGNDVYRGFRTHGYIAFDQQKNGVLPQLLSLDVYNASNVKEEAHPVVLTASLNGIPLDGSSTIQPEANGVYQTKLPHECLQTKDNILDLSILPSGTSSATQVLYIRQMKLDNQVVNLHTLDYPDLSSINIYTHTLSYQYFGKVITDPWQLWDLHAQISMNTLDIWWIKNLYYWDRPKDFFWALLVLDISVAITTGWYTLKHIRYT